MKPYPFILSLVACLIVSGCTLGPQYAPPKVDAPEQFKYAAQGASGQPATIADGQWWRVFNDPLLHQLITQAMENNFDIQAAYHRVDQARAVARYQGAYRYPFVTLDPSYQKGQASKSTQSGIGGSYAQHSLPLSVGWEIDLFGKIRKTYEAGLAEAEASLEAAEAIRLVVQTDITTIYYNMRATDQDIHIVSRALAVRTEQLKILKNRYQVGVISRLPLAQAEAELNATQALLISLQRERARLENAIAILTGKTPSEISVKPDPLTQEPPEIPAVVPSALLTARPDIRSAERILVAENARIGVAEANFYPQIQLSADAGYASYRIEDLLMADSFVWSFMPSMRIPLFEGGKNQAELDRVKARYAEVTANYRQTVLRAFGEVEDALVSADLLKKQEAANQLAVESAMNAYTLSKNQFEGGLVNFLSVLDSERTYLDNLRLSSQLRGLRYLSAVQLIKSIGGKW